MRKHVIFTHFTMKILCVYLYITCNKKTLSKNILAYCGYSLTPFFLLLSEHKHYNNVATNSNKKKVGSRMMASLQGSVGTGTKEDEPSTGHVWAAGFHHITARSRLAYVLKLMKRLFLGFSKFFSGRGKPWVTETTDSEFTDTGICLYMYVCSLLPFMSDVTTTVDCSSTPCHSVHTQTSVV